MLTKDKLFLQDPVLQRAQSLDFYQEAVYRIQYDAEDGFVHFSYLPREGAPLRTSPKYKGGPVSTIAMNTGNGSHVDPFKGGKDDDMQVDDNQGFEPPAKRAKPGLSGF